MFSIFRRFSPFQIIIFLGNKHGNQRHQGVWLPTLCLATNIVLLIMLGNQHCASHYAQQITLCLSIYLGTNIVPLNILGNQHAWEPTCLGTNIVLCNQHCVSHYTWQPTFGLSLYLATQPTCLGTNIVPLIILGNHHCASHNTKIVPIIMLGYQHCDSHSTWQPTLYTS